MKQWRDDIKRFFATYFMINYETGMLEWIDGGEVKTRDYAYEDDLKDAIKLIENFNSIKNGDKHKTNGNRYNKDLIIDAITKGQSQSYISEKYGLSRSQYYKIKASV